MLVLSRKPGESIHIGNNIVLTVVAIRSNQVRIGIQAPEDVRILRQELAEKADSAYLVTASPEAE
jgi:carbon storage regulator